MIKRRKGFTLIEVIVALGLSIIVLSMLFSIFKFERSHINKQEMNLETEDMTRLAYNRIIDTLRMYPNLSIQSHTIRSYLDEAHEYVNVLNYNSIQNDSFINYREQSLFDLNGNIIAKNISKLNVNLITPKLIEIKIESTHPVTKYHYEISTVLNLSKL